MATTPGKKAGSKQQAAAKRPAAKNAAKQPSSSRARKQPAASGAAGKPKKRS